MERWVEIWNTRDADALEDFYASGAVSASDVFGWTQVGREENLEGTRSRMLVTEGLRVQPIYSYASDSTAYQVGPWAIRDPEGWSTGSHIFIFTRTDRGWKLRSAYYVHDPEARLEEFPGVPR